MKRMAQALDVMMMMLRVARVYQLMAQQKQRTLQTMRGWLISRRAFREKSDGGS